MQKILPLLAALALCLVAPRSARAVDDLVIAQGGKTSAQIVVSPQAGIWEKRAATDLQKYIEMMSGAKPALADTREAIAQALHLKTPLVIVGQEAVRAQPSLQGALDKVKKKNPFVRADAIVVRRVGSQVLVAGSNDESHYFAASWLLQSWGCRWYMPTEFGECIPQRQVLGVGDLSFAYAPPFEIRHYWLSWNADQSGADEFRRRNFMTETSIAGMGHALGQYTKDLAPPGGTLFNVPFADPKTAEQVAAKIEPDYAKGVEGISLAIEDGSYETNSAQDKALTAGIADKYMMRPSLTDAMMVFYNDVARRLRLKHPESRTKLGAMAYTNVSIPPQRAFVPEPNLVMWLAPIDIDPIHGMDDANSPSRREYGAMMRRWAGLMQGRLAIYDYDQGMLVWRDLPAPSHLAFAQDVKHYRDAGILGIGTESRGATATTFLNLFLRGQLMWNPDADVNALLAEFYPKFYGPASAPMERYWSAIFNAWKSTLVTEHEYFVAPVIYTPELVAQLRLTLEDAEARMKEAEAKPGERPRDWKKFQERMRFTRGSFDVLSNYTAMVHAAATEGDYKAAVAWGEKGLAARAALGAMNPTFTSTKLESGTAWWPGEVEQYRELSQLSDGPKGTLIARAPLEWAFHRDEHDSGLAGGWAYEPVDLSFWKSNGGKYLPDARRDYPTSEWEMLRTDSYLQAQGVRHADRQSFTGYYWYRTDLNLTPAQANAKVHLMFPGLFNECWLYVNGSLVEHREQGAMWWLNDYKFEWDVDLSGKLKPGLNTLALRGFDPHHLGGLFRRPFLYRPAPP